jgi:O-antigen ligase
LQVRDPSGPATHDRPSSFERLVLVASGVLLVAILALRTATLRDAGPAWLAPGVGLIATALAGALRPSLLGPALGMFGASFLLYGFHSYRPQNQVFEIGVVAFAIALLATGWTRRAAPRFARTWLLRLWLAYGLLAAASLLLLPAAVLRERAFVEGAGLFRAVLDAYPKDPLYPVTGVLRLVQFCLFAWLLARHENGRELCRSLFRGIAAAALLASVLGLLDFFGVVSLAKYNLSHLFFGGQYRRLQSTFGNPSWFACFVACALPFVWLELCEAGRRVRAVVAASIPACALALFFSGARAAWLACAVLLTTLAGLYLGAHRRERPFPSLGWPVRVSLTVTLAGLVAAACWVYVWPSATPEPATPGSQGAQGRLPGLAEEMRLRGLGISSPRSVAARYALALAREAPVYGLGYETFNLHLRAQLAVPSSRVAQVTNAAALIDRTDTYFDDTHDTYLQILVGLGAVGLILWLALAVASLALVAAAYRHAVAVEAAAVLAAMIVFHVYGAFQGMQYVPVIWFLFHLCVAYAMTLEVVPPPALLRASRVAFPVLVLLLACSPAVYVANRGWRSFRARHELATYLPDEAAEFVGFYRAEKGPAGEFRWMARRGIVHVFRTAPFGLVLTCDQPGLDREPVVVSIRFQGRDLGAVVFRHPGAIEKRFGAIGPGSLRLEVSRTFRPGGADARDLGVAVSAIRWE